MSMEYWMNTFMDKVKDLLKGIDSDAWINNAIEKLKKTQVTVTDIAKILMNKAEHVFPLETRAEQIQQWKNVAQKYAKPVSIALLIIILYRVFYGRGGGGGGKTMKAPGRNYRMSRSDFEGNPKGYFRGLRK